MTYQAQPGGVFNVEGSFNDFFARQVTGKGLPAFMPTAVVNFDYPQAPLTYPSFSVTHLGSTGREVAQGRNLDPGWRGIERVGLAEISCWESYARASGQHSMNIRQMRDMAARVFATGAVMPILNVYAYTANPPVNGTIIRADPVDDQGTLPDPDNPDVVRRRLLVQYRWLERVSAGG